LKTRAVNSVRGNRNMIGKIPTWWENSVRGNRKTAGKNSAMVGNFPQWEKKSLTLHGSFSTAAPVLYAGIYLSLFSQCIPITCIPGLCIPSTCTPRTCIPGICTPSTCILGICTPRTCIPGCTLSTCFFFTCIMHIYLHLQFDHNNNY
jgi:hypothetical protein